MADPKDFGGGISESARSRMTEAISNVRQAVTVMEKTIKKEHRTAVKSKKDGREESKRVRAAIQRVNNLITKKNGEFGDALRSFTKTVNDLEGDVTVLVQSYQTLPRKKRQ